MQDRSLFLPVTRKDMEDRGIAEVDFVYVSGDAYVDHPSFGAAIITRVLEAEGFSVAMLAQPDFHSAKDFTRFGRPRLGFLVSAGNIDSMVAHYTVSKKKRNYDYYSPGGKTGLRPDRAVTVYCNRIREAYPDAAILIGGLEASLRRFAHYDYWTDRVRRSVLLDSRADLLMYGMGENTVVRIARLLDKGVPVRKIRDVRGTVYLADRGDKVHFDAIEVGDYETLRTDKAAYAEAFATQYRNADSHSGKALIEYYGNKMLVQNPPMPPLEREELDRVYALPFARDYHPDYEAQGGVPAISEVKFSITHNRGCFGACNFCAIAFHQGREVRSRSEESVLAEAKLLTGLPDFKGYIHDVGGPTANFRYPSCDRQKTAGVCPNRKCLSPTPCKNLKVDHSEYLHLLSELEKIPKVKRVFIRSGIRFDYLLYDRDDSFFRALVERHVSGQLKVAPEHCSNNALSMMGKPPIEVYEAFKKKYFSLCAECGKEQYIVPYLMSSHPGSTMKDAVEMAVRLKKWNLRPEQVQDFYPTPGTISTAMYYTGIHPMTGKPIYVPADPREKMLQRALLQYANPENAGLVREALKLAGREDLIGNSPECLVRPAFREGTNTHFDTAKRGGKAARQNAANNNSPRKGGTLRAHVSDPVGSYDKKSFHFDRENSLKAGKAQGKTPTGSKGRKPASQAKPSPSGQRKSASGTPRQSGAKKSAAKSPTGKSGK